MSEAVDGDGSAKLATSVMITRCIRRLARPPGEIKLLVRYAFARDSQAPAAWLARSAEECGTTWNTCAASAAGSPSDSKWSVSSSETKLMGCLAAASRRKFDQHIRSLIAAVVADGSIAPCDPKIATFTVLGSLNWISQWYKSDGELSADQVATAVVDQLFRGFDR
jgi:Tetracyclin repressor-like, C-terminal domain